MLLALDTATQLVGIALHDGMEGRAADAEVISDLVLVEQCAEGLYLAALRLGQLDRLAGHVLSFLVHGVRSAAIPVELRPDSRRTRSVSNNRRSA